MSRFDGFSDYISDIPMEIGRKFYPRPEIILPKIAVPRLPDSSNKYDFKVEHHARKMFDARNDKPQEQEPPAKQVENTPIFGATSSISLPNRLEVLQPSRIENSIAAVSISTPETSKAVSFEEFESKGTIFDEVEWKSIDDRKALSQILNGSYSFSEPTTPIPQKPEQQIGVSLNLPSYPSLNYNSSESTKLGESKILNGNTVSYSKTSSATPAPTASSSKNNVKVPLRQRLLTKGYRENLVNVAMTKVPQERIVHIEYYMKGMSTLEKRGIPVESSLSYLLNSGVTDKQDVLQRAQTADQLLSMGFSTDRVFTALLSSDGDRLKALDNLLSS